MNDSRLMSPIAAALTGLLTGLSAVLVLASPAVAHARLLGSTPKDRSTVTAVVTEIRLRFSEPVKQSRTTVRVTSADGATHTDGEPVAVDATVAQKVSPLPAGVITVDWRTVSADGHTITGSFTFTNRAAPPAATSAAVNPAPSRTQPTPAVVSPTAGTIDARPASAAAESAGQGWIWIIVVPILIAAGGALWWLRRRAHR
jgi:hypothetical protein